MARKKAQQSGSLPPFADRYRIERELGRGGGGVVYLAEDGRLAGTRVALKVLDLKENDDPSLALALENEFRALSSLRHRHLARVLDFGRSATALHLSSEWIDGVDLLEAAREADLNTVFRLVVQTLRALDYLHKRGVLHLDLKPANILVTDPARSGELTVRLIDFGLAQWKRKGVESSGGEFSGTAPYAAPEQILGQPVGPAADLYALGMILHRIFAKEFPFSSQDPMQIMQLQLYGEAQRVRHLHEALPESFAELLQRSVAKDPAQRFASAGEFLQAINRSLEENFSLRDSRAPVAILEESDHLFRPELLERLRKNFSGAASPRIALIGATGLGKSRLLLHLKEWLQLRGQHPWWISQIESLQASPPLPQAPLLFDLDGEALETWRNWTASPAAGEHPWIAALPEGASVPESVTVETLAPLDRRAIAEFFLAEIREFPTDAGLDAILVQSEGRPDRLETLLQAMREEGSLQWGESGWRWSGDSVETLNDLLPRHEARWRERRERVAELLRLAPLGFDTEALAGILGVDAAALETRLGAWSAAGYLERNTDDAEAATRWTVARGAETVDTLPLDWKELQGELERRYESGEFPFGARLADLLAAREPRREAIPDSLRIVGARHYAAAGRNEDALAFLPSGPPAAPDWAGLYWEVRTRCLAALGRLEEAQATLERAREHYQTAGQKSGLARCFNLAGWIHKKSGALAAAQADYERSRDAAAAAQDSYAQGLAELNLGTVFHDQGQLDLAGQCYDQALRSATRAGHPLLQLKLNQNRVNLLYTMGRAAEAEAGCYELLRLAIRQHYPEEQAAALNFLALFAGQRGDDEAQRRYLDQAIVTLAERGAAALLPQLYFNRAYLHWSAKKYPAAQLDAEAAVAAAHRLRNPFLAAWGDLLLGKILRDRKKPDLEGAGRLLGSARIQMREQRLQHLLWEAEFDLGLLAKKRGDPAAAATHFNEAKRELETLLPQLPEGLRQSYLRDRKLERIVEELNDL